MSCATAKKEGSSRYANSIRARSTRLAGSVRERAIAPNSTKSFSPIANSIACRHAVMSSTLSANQSRKPAKILHIDTMIIWLLMGFMGAIYWFLPDEFGRELAGIKAAEILFYVFCAAVAVVAVVFIFVQYGGSDETALWLINQGRKYVEAPRWAAIGVVVVMAVFAYNVLGTAYTAGKITGITAVLMIDLVPLLILYLDAFPAISNMSADLFWWWWLVHLWVEATWEVLIACIMALALMQLLGT